MNKTDEILNKAYARRVTPDPSGGYVVTVSEFPGCVAEGETADEAISNFNQVATSWIESALHQNYPIREPLDFEGLSGKIALRIPRSLHRDLAEMADLEDVSINQLIVSSIASYVSQKGAVYQFESAISKLLRDTHALIIRASFGNSTFKFMSQSLLVDDNLKTFKIPFASPNSLTEKTVIDM